MAIFVVNKTENATKIKCSLRPNVESLKYPIFSITNVPRALMEV